MGSVMSATSAPRAASAACASTVAATPCAPAPNDTVRPVIVSSAITGHAVLDHGAVTTAGGHGGDGVGDLGRVLGQRLVPGAHEGPGRGAGQDLEAPVGPHHPAGQREGGHADGGLVERGPEPLEVFVEPAAAVVGPLGGWQRCPVPGHGGQAVGELLDGHGLLHEVGGSQGPGPLRHYSTGYSQDCRTAGVNQCR